MGTLLNFNLHNYGCNIYVETGTGLGETLNKAINSKFDKCYSIDLDLELVNSARKAFPEAEILHGLSTEKLEELVPTLSQDDGVLFFLDAHFPGSDYRGAKYDVSAPNAVPLEQELQIIHKYRPNCSDYIICDDARIYKRGPYQQGNYPEELVPGGLDFVYKLYPKYKVKLSYLEHGYLLIDNRI